MVSEVLEKTGETLRARETIFKAVVCMVLLYGSKSWLIMDTMMKVLEAFHHRIDRRITGNIAWFVREEGW